MKILICDDEEQFLRQLEGYVKDYFQNRHINYHLMATKESADVINSKDYFDLAFLDIQMPVNGIDLAKELKKRNSKVVLFFITNYEEYQDDAMDLHAFRYFEKPFNPDRLYSGLDKAMEYIDEAYIDLYLNSDGTQQRILVDDILYITRENRRVLIITRDNSYVVKESFDHWIDKLPSLYFYLVHNSFFVNLHYVEKYDYKELIMSGGTRIPVAPRKQSAFHRFWFEYLRRR